MRLKESPKEWITCIYIVVAILLKLKESPVEVNQEPKSCCYTTEVMRITLEAIQEPKKPQKLLLNRESPMEADCTTKRAILSLLYSWDYGSHPTEAKQCGISCGGMPGKAGWQASREVKQELHPTWNGRRNRALKTGALHVWHTHIQPASHILFLCEIHPSWYTI